MILATAAADHNQGYKYEASTHTADHPVEKCFVLKLKQDLTNTWQTGVMDEYLEYIVTHAFLSSSFHSCSSVVMCVGCNF